MRRRPRRQAPASVRRATAFFRCELEVNRLELEPANPRRAPRSSVSRSISRPVDRPVPLGVAGIRQEVARRTHGLCAGLSTPCRASLSRCSPQRGNLRPIPPKGERDMVRGRQEQHAYFSPPIRRHACGDRCHARDRKPGGSCCVFGSRGIPRRMLSARSRSRRPMLERDDRLAASRDNGGWPATACISNGARRSERRRPTRCSGGGTGTRSRTRSAGSPVARGYTVGVDTFDRDDDHSLPPRPRSPPRRAPTRQRRPRRPGCARSPRPKAPSCSPGHPRRTTSASSSTASTPPACVSRRSSEPARRSRASLWQELPDRARRSRRRRQPLRAGRLVFHTSACPSTNKPPTTPTGFKVTAATATSVTLSLAASTDDVAVTGYGLYLSGSKANQRDNRDDGAEYTGSSAARRTRSESTPKTPQACAPPSHALHRDLTLLHPPPPPSARARSPRRSRTVRR